MSLRFTEETPSFHLQALSFFIREGIGPYNVDIHGIVVAASSPSSSSSSPSERLLPLGVIIVSYEQICKRCLVFGVGGMLSMGGSVPGL
jgi:hypothetical protein